MRVLLKLICIALYVITNHVSNVKGESFLPKVNSIKSDSVSRQITYFEKSSNILARRGHSLYISLDEGLTWKKIQELEDKGIIKYQIDPLYPNRAFALTGGNDQYVTNDKGLSWTKFNIPLDDKERIASRISISSNIKKPDVLLASFYVCPVNHLFDSTCNLAYYYTDDGFRSNLKKMGDGFGKCVFAKSNELFEGGQDNTIYCSVNKLNSFGHVVESNLLASDNFFKTSKRLEIRDTGALIDIRIEHNFIIGIIQKDKFTQNSRIAIVVSQDGSFFNEVNLNLNIAYGAIFYLDSSPRDLFLAIVDYNRGSRKPVTSTIYSANSRGTAFFKVLDNVNGLSIKKVETIDGSWLANVVDEIDGNSGYENALPEALTKKSPRRMVRSVVSIDNGRNWLGLRVSDDKSCNLKDGCSLHILSPSEVDGEGNFVTGPTPGILMAVGSKGNSLATDLEHMNTWVSRDGGLTWNFSLKEPCKFSFADQGNIIVAVPFFTGGLGIDKVYFSLNQGKSFETVKLPTSFFPLNLLSAADGSSDKFLLSGFVNNDSKDREIIYHLDFSEAFQKKKCGNRDLEEVTVRVHPESGEPLCFFGRKEKFQRRKQDAMCLVREHFEGPVEIDELCQCTIADFECGDGYIIQGNDECVPDDKRIETLCRLGKTKKLTLFNRVLKKGNMCTNPGEISKSIAKTKDFDCKDFLGDENDHDKGTKNDIVSVQNEFKGLLDNYYYFESDEITNTESIVARTKRGDVYASKDGGLSFVKIPTKNRIDSVYVNQLPLQIILTSLSSDFYYSLDGGFSYYKKKAPKIPNTADRSALSFHPNEAGRFIWYGEGNCDGIDELCQTDAYLTTDYGELFSKLEDNVVSCDFLSPIFNSSTKVEDDLIYCTKPSPQGPGLSLITINHDLMNRKTLFNNIAGYAITGSYLIVAAIHEGTSLRAKVTVDGNIFADAHFPPDINVKSEQAYTVLDSSTKAIFLHVTTNNEKDEERGLLLKSNSNGTSYVTSLENVNRDSYGFVDFDRIEELEGVIISNVVQSPDRETPKRLKTLITHNDGAQWAYIIPPSLDCNGEKYDCSEKPLSQCSLNLHGFTERKSQDEFSSASAVGLLIGVGNVGETLESYDKSSTFISRDGGITWKEVQKGVTLWEYGDRGTIIVLVTQLSQTNTLLYSLDEGETWESYKFCDKPVRVLDLATVPSDTSRKFTIWSRGDSANGIAYTIDFTDIHKRQCKLDLDNPEDDDFEYWSPKHPFLPDNCLFGHEVKYLRRSEDRTDCFIGKSPLEIGFREVRVCPCSRRDFECDYNFYRDLDDTCKLIPGLSPSDHLEICKRGNVFEYSEPTGYRKIPLSTCVGGKEFDKWKVHPCPGKEKEFNKYYGHDLSKGKVIAIFVVPLIIFVLVTWIVYYLGIRRNGGFKRLGQIRLDQDDDDFAPVENNALDKIVNGVVRGGVVLVGLSLKLWRTLSKVTLSREASSNFFKTIGSGIIRRRPLRTNYVHIPDDVNEEGFSDNLPESGNFEESSISEEDALMTGSYQEGRGTETPIGQNEENLFNISDHSDNDMLNRV